MAANGSLDAAVDFPELAEEPDCPVTRFVLARFVLANSWGTVVCGTILIRHPTRTSSSVLKLLKTGKPTLRQPSNCCRPGKFSARRVTKSIFASTKTGGCAG